MSYRTDYMLRNQINAYNAVRSDSDYMNDPKSTVWVNRGKVLPFYKKMQANSSWTYKPITYQRSFSDGSYARYNRIGDWKGTWARYKKFPARQYSAPRSSWSFKRSYPSGNFQAPSYYRNYQPRSNYQSYQPGFFRQAGTQLKYKVKYGFFNLMRKLLFWGVFFLGLVAIVKRVVYALNMAPNVNVPNRTNTDPFSAGSPSRIA